MSYEPEMPAAPSVAAEKTNLPGIFLIVVGAVNILGALYFLVDGILLIAAPEQMGKLMMDMYKSMGVTNVPKEAVSNMRTTGVMYAGLGLVSLVGCGVTILAGLRMRSLRSYGLAMTGSIIAAIPCISCLGCCGIGEAIGIWAIVVLLNEQVKQSFT